MKKHPHFIRNTIRVLAIVMVLCAALSIYRLWHAPRSYQPKYHTVAHHFLDLEANYVALTDEHYELLDNLIDSVRANVHYDPTITDPAKQRQQLLEVFNSIDGVLTENNFIFPPKKWTNTLGEALTEHSLSQAELQAALAEPHNARRVSHMKQHANENFHLMACEPGAFLYMGIAEALGFELKPVTLPQHMFVRAQIDKNQWINWDPNRGRSISDTDYIQNWGVQAWQVTDQIYMKPLSTDETESEMFGAIGCYLGDYMVVRGWGPSNDAYRKALSLNPRNIYANTNLSGNLVMQEHPDAQTRHEAIQFARRAEELEPNDAHMHRCVSFALAADGQTTAAVSEMQRAIDCDPRDESYAQWLPQISAGKTLWEITRDRSPFVFWIAIERGWIDLLLSICFILATVLMGLVYLFRRRRRRRVSADASDRLAQIQQ